jgi:hypothetical protein
MNFGDECNGLLFNFDGSNNKITLRYPDSVLDKLYPLAFGEVYFEIMVNGNSISIDMYINDTIDDNVDFYYGKKPTNQTDFEEFTKFLIGQLCTVESKFAEVDECILDKDKMEYTVHGFLIPRQTIGFDSYSDWNCIKGVMGQPIFDCQIDEDYDPKLESDVYNFQIVDLNYDVDEGRFDLDDTPKLGGGHINRNYTGVHLVFKEEGLEVVHHGLLKTIEVREFKIGDSLYEVVIDCEDGRTITNINAEKGEVTPQIMETLQNAVEKIEI